MNNSNEPLSQEDRERMRRFVDAWNAPPAARGSERPSMVDPDQEAAWEAGRRALKEEEASKEWWFAVARAAVEVEHRIVVR